MQAINFYQISAPYGWVSNFAPYPIELDGKVWPTSEHYFQASKFPGSDYAEAIRQQCSPMIAARMGRSRKVSLRADWEDVKDSILSTPDLLLARALPGGDYPKFGKYLTLFFYARVEDGTAFEFWSDYHTEALWLPREAALAQVEVAEDR